MSLSAARSQSFVATLAARFAQNPQRHPHLDWAVVAAELDAYPAKLVALHRMEATGGEPDVVGVDEATGESIFMDCSPESPAGRTALCFDRAGGGESRKAHPPAGSVVATAAAMGVELLTEDQYRHLQTLGEFDLKSSRWIATPADVRRLGGALFGDRRYGRAFIYHNGAQSYYAARGFSACLRV